MVDRSKFLFDFVHQEAKQARLLFGLFDDHRHLIVVTFCRLPDEIAYVPIFILYTNIQMSEVLFYLEADRE